MLSLEDIVGNQKNQIFCHPVSLHEVQMHFNEACLIHCTETKNPCAVGCTVT